MPTDAQKRTRNKWDAENMSVISCKNPPDRITPAGGIF